MECRIALVLTTSAGDAKEPTVHRALLLREGLSDEWAVDSLRPWLTLLGDNIRIEKELSIVPTTFPTTIGRRW